MTPNMLFWNVSVKFIASPFMYYFIQAMQCSGTINEVIVPLQDGTSCPFCKPCPPVWHLSAVHCWKYSKQMKWICKKWGRLVRSPWSDKKVSGRARHNSVALPTAEGQREGDRICPALTETFMSLQGDLHYMGWRQMSLLWWGGVKNPPGGVAFGANSLSSWFFWLFANKKWLLIELSYFIRRIHATSHGMMRYRIVLPLLQTNKQEYPFRNDSTSLCSHIK